MEVEAEAEAEVELLGWGVANRASVVVEIIDTGLLGSLFYSGGIGVAGGGLPLEERAGGRMAAATMASAAASGLL